MRTILLQHRKRKSENRSRISFSRLVLARKTANWDIAPDYFLSSAAQLVTNVSGECMDCGLTAAIMNFWPSGNTAYGTLVTVWNSRLIGSSLTTPTLNESFPGVTVAAARTPSDRQRAGLPALHNHAHTIMLYTCTPSCLRRRVSIPASRWRRLIPWTMFLLRSRWPWE